MGALDVARRQSEAGVAWSDRHGTDARARGAEEHGSDDQPRHRTGDEPGTGRRLADRSTDWAGAVQRIVLADLVCCPTSSRPKTRRESAPCCVANPRQVSNLAVARALPGADFASFPIAHGVLLTGVKAAFSSARVIPRTSGTAH